VEEEAVDEGEEEAVDEGEEEAEEDTEGLEAAIVAAAAVEASPKPMRLRALVKNVFGKIPIWESRLGFPFFFFFSPCRGVFL